MANVNFPITIKERFNYPVTVDIAGLYSISISARVKSAKQINGSDDEDLQIEIDCKKFREIPPLNKPQYKNIPPAFNGGKLQGLKKTVVFFIWLEKGSHIVSLIPDHSAIIENVMVEKKENIQNITLAINEQAEDGDRRPWFAFIFVDLAVKEISASVIARSRWLDRDDAQIKIDGEIQQYKKANPLHRLWYWIGSLFKEREEMAYFKPNLSEGIHYIEINADRMPTLNNISFILGDARPKGIIKDTNQGIIETKFRREPKRTEDNIISEIPVGEEVEILEEVVEGEYVTNMSNIWHNVLYKGQQGYIISTYVDIEGKTQEIVKNKIIQAARELNMDENLMLAIAKAESHFKPYAVSVANAKGIFQLTKIAIDQLKKKSMGNLCYELTDPFNIEQNIQGGARYFKWLHKVYYKGDKEALQKALAGYNWGQNYVSQNIPFKQIQIPENVKQYVKEVLDYKKEFEQNGFSRIKIIVSVLFAFVFFVIIANVIQSLNYSSNVGNDETVKRSNFATLTLNSKLNNEVAHAGIDINEEDLLIAPRVYLNEDNKIVFVNSNNNVARYLDKNRLKISLFNASDNMPEIYPVIYVMGDVIEQPDNVFYFFATTGYACGSGGCSYVFYKYQALSDKLAALDDRKIMGDSPKMFLSPDKKKIAVLSHMRAGLSCPASQLAVFDLMSGMIEKITGFNDDNFQESMVESIKWKTDTEIIFTIENFNCNARWEGSWIRNFMYDIKNQKLTLMSEKFVPASKSGG